jgi:hypothetical protein
MQRECFSMAMGASKRKEDGLMLEVRAENVPAD